MKPNLQVLALTLCALTVGAAPGSRSAHSAGMATAAGATNPPTAVPTVAMLVTSPGSPTEVTDLFFARPERLGPAVATLHHREGTVRASVIENIVFAIAPWSPGADRSFDSALFEMGLGAPPRRLVESCVHASRPENTPEGLFVVRGTPGTKSGAGRVDTFTVDRIDRNTGAPQTLSTWAGHFLHLAGWHDGELIVYRVDAQGAEIVAIATTDGRPRPVASLPPFARDFSLHDGELIFRGRSDGTWTVESINLHSLRHRVLSRDVGFSAAPHVWPDGDVVFNPQRLGLHRLDGTVLPTLAALTPSRHVGVDWILTTNDEFAAGLHTRQQNPSVPFVMHARGPAKRLPHPSGKRIAIAGFVEMP